uniref:RNase H type-1 domain-containing protein n=1 Tax=Chenopodium quinoa TaxID=63459 RepID=A0A803N666_CHEQI
MINELFLPFERERILGIPLSSRLPEDRLCWDLEKDGEYSVRSAYRAISGDVDAELRTSSSSSHKVWSKVGLSKRLQNDDRVCGLCGVEEETELHCMRDCIVARLLWDKSWLENVLGVGHSSFGDAALAYLEKSPKSGHGFFMTVCWAIWNARNRWIFVGERCNPQESMAYVNKLMVELGGKEEKGRGCVAPAARQRWKPPQRNVWKLNVDGGVVEGVGSCAGAVIRGRDGAVVMCMTWMGEERWSPAIVEAKALLMGLQAAVECGYRRLVVESDCLGLINALDSRERGSSCFHLILDDIYHVCRSLDFVSSSFVHREGNTVAHELAHLPWVVGSRFWFDNFPSCIDDLLSSDLPNNEN